MQVGFNSAPNPLREGEVQPKEKQGEPRGAV